MSKPLNVVEELLGAFELFRRLDFLSDDIFVVVHADYVSVKLLGDGEREFVVTISATVPDEPLTADRWTRAADEWNGTMTDDERARIYKSSRAYTAWSTILTNMRRVRFQPKGGWSPEIEALSTTVASGAWAPEPDVIGKNLN